MWLGTLLFASRASNHYQGPLSTAPAPIVKLAARCSVSALDQKLPTRKLENAKITQEPLLGQRLVGGMVAEKPAARASATSIFILQFLSTKSENCH